MFGGKNLSSKIIRFPVYLSRELLRPHICRFRRSRSGKLLVVDVHSWIGLFAHLEYFLEMSLHCERYDLTPCFMSTSAQYVDPERGPNWFEYFFTNLQLSLEDSEKIKHGEVPICRIEGIRQLGLPEDYDPQLNLRIGPKLVRKYIGIRPEVMDKVNSFFERHLINKCVLGIHYRGTDKRAEAPLLAYADFGELIDSFLARNSGFDCLFVSSDEQRFVDYIEGKFKQTLPVFYHDDHERAQTETAIRRSRSGDRYRKAEEAIVNSLLLSKCRALIKTASFLSGWSKLFNPDLPVYLLNPPFKRQLWFPDRDLALANSGFLENSVKLGMHT
jgi:hypothetical protein